MNIKNQKLSTITLLVHLMCFTVVLSHIHAKDAVSLLSQQASMNKFIASDITAKALGDLHHHIDKASLKNISVDSSTTAARTRELNPLAVSEVDDSIATRFNDFLLRIRVVGSLFFQYA